MKRVNLSMPDGTFESVERARGDVSRSRFILRAVESALGRDDDAAVVPAQSPPSDEDPLPPRIVGAVRESWRVPVVERQQTKSIAKAVKQDQRALQPLSRAEAFRRAQGKKK